eukprot:gene18396-5865_t
MPAVCHNYMAGRCRKTADECKYRHPEACIQHKKGRCSKKGGTCRFAHVGPPQFDRPPRVQPYVDIKKDLKLKTRAEKLENEINAKQRELEKIRRKEEEQQEKIDRERQRKAELKEAQALLGDAYEAFKDAGGLAEDTIEPLTDFYSEQQIVKAFTAYVKNHPGPGLDLLCTRQHAHQLPAGQRRLPPNYRADGSSAHEQTASFDAPPKHWMRSTREWNKLMHATNGNIITTAPRRPGDWNCGRCSAHNFSRRQTCIGCGAPRPPPAAAPA